MDWLLPSENSFDFLKFIYFLKKAGSNFQYILVLFCCLTLFFCCCFLLRFSLLCLSLKLTLKSQIPYNLRTVILSFLLHLYHELPILQEEHHISLKLTEGYDKILFVVIIFWFVL